MPAMWRRLLPLSLAEWRHHPWRHGVALLAVALGVALAASVQMINHSALSEFAHAVRSANGDPDVVLASIERQGFDDHLLDTLLADERVAVASPLLEVDSHARAAVSPGHMRPAAPAGSGLADEPLRVAIRVVGIDALQVARVVPALLPQPGQSSEASGGRGPMVAIDPASAWLNAAARQRLHLRDGDPIEIQTSSGWQRLTVAGSVAAAGAPMVVADVAWAQQAFGRNGRLHRIDVRLAPGVDREAWLPGLRLPEGVRVAAADEAVQRVSNLSRAYRVNLGVLALVALLVGGFLVYSVVSLSVAQRTPALALLGVLGVDARQRRQWILLENAMLGALGGLLGLAGGAALATLALHLLGGDLGGGFFPGVAPALAWPWPALAACGALGTMAAVAGAWWPARQAEALSPAQALKGLGGSSQQQAPRWLAPALLLMAVACAMLPPIAGMPLAAYASVGMMLAGGVALVPLAVALMLRPARPSRPSDAHAPLPSSGAPRARSSHAGTLAWLAWRRARFARQTASATMAGVVASLALSVALTVMVSSFRLAVTDWLDHVLPADLYARSSASAAAADQAVLPQDLPQRVAGLPGVTRVQAMRVVPMAIDPALPSVALMARPLPQPEQTLPLVGPLVAALPGEAAVFVSEPAAALHRWQVGQLVRLPLPQGPIEARVRGIWRDYARQFGAVAIDLADYQRLTGDRRFNDLSIWLAPGASPAQVQAAVKHLAGPDHPLDSASTAELRRISLAIFDRSFAVTRYLQAVAITVGLVGVAASLSAQVLARRKEFGLLAHLGLQRRQVLGLVTLESLAWLGAGCVVGVGLGLAVAVVLVHVVNPQSFHWTMPLHIPLSPLAGLAAAVMLAGGMTAAFSARHAASAQAVQAVKEDW